jgi:hypothetical protein
VKPRIACFVALLATAFAAHAEPRGSHGAIDALKARIAAQYNQAQASCLRVDGHAREVCEEKAQGERDVQLSALQLQAQPSAENDRKLQLTKAEAAYEAAMVRCQAELGAARRVCRETAQAALNAAKAEAQMPNGAAAQALHAENAARERGAQADRIAAAQLAVARERCEMLPVEAQQACMGEARRRFSRS